MEDSIAAIATPLGDGGLAVIRVSGPQALTIVDRIFEPHGRGALKPSAAATHTLQIWRNPVPSIASITRAAAGDRAARHASSYTKTNDAGQPAPAIASIAAFSRSVPA